ELVDGPGHVHAVGAVEADGHGDVLVGARLDLDADGDRRAAGHHAGVLAVVVEQLHRADVPPGADVGGLLGGDDAVGALVGPAVVAHRPEGARHHGVGLALLHQVAVVEPGGPVADVAD